MLLIKDQTKKADLSIELDAYVPFQVEFGAPISQPLYWRGGDGERSLIEVGIDSISGAISSTTLTSFDAKTMRRTDALLDKSVNEICGRAIFDIDDWDTNSPEFSDRFKDEFDRDFSLTVGIDYLSLDFVNVGRPSFYIKNDQFRIGVSPDGGVSSFQLTELTDAQIDTLLQSTLAPT